MGRLEAFRSRDGAFRYTRWASALRNPNHWPEAPAAARETSQKLRVAKKLGACSSAGLYFPSM